jgi:hypothetical protein
LLNISETIRNGKRKGKAFSLFRAKGWKMRERERERERGMDLQFGVLPSYSLTA